MKRPSASRQGAAPTKTPFYSGAWSNALLNTCVVIAFLAPSWTAGATPPQMRQLEPVSWTRKEGVPSSDRMRLRSIDLLNKLGDINKEEREVAPQIEALHRNAKAPEYASYMAALHRVDEVRDLPAQQAISGSSSVIETLWFRTICIMLGAGLLCLLFSLRTRYISTRARERAEERANERVRIARDLHDTLLQGVQALMWRFQIAAHELPDGSKTRGTLDSALASAETILSEARERVKSLRETPLGSEDLASALARVGSELNWTGSVAFQVETRGNAYPLAPAIQEEVFSVAREALTNSFRHSQASEITIEITFARRSVVLSCRDNGCGMSPDVLNEGVAGHWGLLGMRERAGKLGAKLECWSTVGSGTEVFLSVSRKGLRYRRCCTTGIRLS